MIGGQSVHIFPTLRFLIYIIGMKLRKMSKKIFVGPEQKHEFFKYVAVFIIDNMIKHAQLAVADPSFGRDNITKADLDNWYGYLYSGAAGTTWMLWDLYFPFNSELPRDVPFKI